MRGENGKEKGMEKGKKEKGKENGKGERESKRRKEILNICPTTLSTDFQIDGNGPVSYTHLTLPTKRIV